MNTLNYDSCFVDEDVWFLCRLIELIYILVILYLYCLVVEVSRESFKIEWFKKSVLK